MSKQDEIIEAVRQRNADRLYELLRNETELSLNYSNRGAEGARDVGNDGAKVVAQAWAKGLRLIQITFWDTGIGDEGAQALSEVLQHDRHLKLIRFSYNKIGDIGASILAKALATNTTLETFDLGANDSITDHGAIKIAEALLKNNSLTFIHLGCPKVTTACIPHFIEGLQKNNTSLTSLWGNGDIFSKNEVLGKLLQRNKNLAVMLSQLGNPELSELDLSSKGIGDLEAKAIANKLKINRTITRLNLSSNDIGAKGAEEIAETLKVNRSLIRLNLTHNRRIGNEGAKALANVLKSNINSTLTELFLNQNEIGLEGAIAIAELIKANSALTYLNLWENKIDDEGAIVIATALETNIVLTSLILNNNKIGIRGIRALATALEKNYTITYLNIIDKNDPNVSEEIKELIKKIDKLIERNLNVKHQLPQKELQDSFDDLVSIRVWGPIYSGKTCLVKRFVDHSYRELIPPHPGVAIYDQTIVLKNGNQRKYQLFDCNGAESSKKMIGSYVRGADVVLICLDITDKERFEESKEYIKIAQKETHDKALIIAVGTKMDDKRAISFDAAKKLVNKWGVKFYFECSAKFDLGIKELFIEALGDLLEEKTPEQKPLRETDVNKERKQLKIKLKEPLITQLEEHKPSITVPSPPDISLAALQQQLLQDLNPLRNSDNNNLPASQKSYELTEKELFNKALEGSKKAYEQLLQITVEDFNQSIVQDKLLLEQRLLEHEKQQQTLQGHIQKLETELQKHILDEQATSDVIRQRLEVQQNQLRELKIRQRILWKEHKVKKEQIRMLEKFKNSPNLLLYYRTIQVCIQQLFISCFAGAGGKPTLESGETLDMSQQGLEFFGDLCNIAPIVGPAVNFVLKWGVAKVLEKIDGARQENSVKNVASLLSLAELNEMSESVAQKLTIWYEPILKNLAALDDETQLREDKKKQGRIAKLKEGMKELKGELQEAILKKKHKLSACKAAEFAITWALDELEEDKFDPNQPLDDQFVWVILTKKASYKSDNMPSLIKKTSQIKEDIAINISKALGKKTVQTKTGETWHLWKMYTDCGIQTETEIYGNKDASTYGYCNGIGNEIAARVAKARELSFQKENQKHRSKKEPAKNSPASPAHLHELKNVGVETKHLKEKLNKTETTAQIGIAGVKKENAKLKDEIEKLKQQLTAQELQRQKEMEQIKQGIPEEVQKQIQAMLSQAQTKPTSTNTPFWRPSSPQTPQTPKPTSQSQPSKENNNLPSP